MKKTMSLYTQQDISRCIEVLANLNIRDHFWRIILTDEDAQTYKQRKFHFAVCTEIGMKKGISTDPEICKKAMHEYYKAMFLPVEHHEIDGTVIDIYDTTLKYSRKGMAEHTTKCIAHAASEWGIILERDMQ